VVTTLNIDFMASPALMGRTIDTVLH
jgi:hypothetical protein